MTRTLLQYFISVTLVVLAPLIIAGCSLQAKSTQDTGGAHPAYPPGIVTPASVQDAVRAGLYPGDTADQCCFLSDRATIEFAAPATAHYATLTFYVPEHRPFDKHSERVIVMRAGRTISTNDFPKGTHSLRLQLPSAGAGYARRSVTLRMALAYVPKALGINDDVRKISIMLVSITYK